MTSSYRIGEMVFAAEPIHNDGGVPEVDDDALLADKGRRGVVVQHGHVEADSALEIYLVRFENDGGTLGPPVGCLPEELCSSTEGNP